MNSESSLRRARRLADAEADRQAFDAGRPNAAGLTKSDYRSDACPACGKPLTSEGGALLADRDQPWEKRLPSGRVRTGYRIVGVHFDCAKANPKRFTADLFARPGASS